MRPRKTHVGDAPARAGRHRAMDLDLCAIVPDSAPAVTARVGPSCREGLFWPRRGKISSFFVFPETDESLSARCGTIARPFAGELEAFCLAQGTLVPLGKRDLRHQNTLQHNGLWQDVAGPCEFLGRVTSQFPPIAAAAGASLSGGHNAPATAERGGMHISQTFLGVYACLRIRRSTTIMEHQLQLTKLPLAPGGRRTAEPLCRWKSSFANSQDGAEYRGGKGLPSDRQANNLRDRSCSTFFVF